MTGGDDFDELLRRWSESDRRSRQRRSAPRPRRTGRRVAVPAVLLAAGAFAATSPDIGELFESQEAKQGERARAAPQRDSGVRRVARSPATPSVPALRRAWRFARRRGGQVSLAVVDTRGRLRGRDAGRRYVSASVVKAVLLAAELRRLRRDGLPLDERTAELLKAMIVESDNRSADAIYARVGDAGLRDAAKAAGMRRFAVDGYWANAQVTAADLARFFSRVRGLLRGPGRGVALRLLGSITKEQRWGIPRAADGWRTHFKGGWRETPRGELVHQAAWLHDGRRDLAIAVLTDAQPSRIHAIHTVRGVAERLLAR